MLQDATASVLSVSRIRRTTILRRYYVVHATLDCSSRTVSAVVSVTGTCDYHRATQRSQSSRKSQLVDAALPRMGGSLWHV